MAGAGSAGMGVANIVHQYKKKMGASVEKAYNDFYIFDHEGLITRGRKNLNFRTLQFAQPDSNLEGKNMIDIIK